MTGEVEGWVDATFEHGMYTVTIQSTGGIVVSTTVDVSAYPDMEDALAHLTAMLGLLPGAFIDGTSRVAAAIRLGLDDIGMN
jgi:hypothetical protein